MTVDRVDYELEYQRHRDFAYASADWFWEMDANLRFTWMSRSVHDVLGVAPEWHYGKTREELLGDSYDASIWASNLADLRAHRAFRDFDYFRDAPGVPPTWIRINGVPVHDAAGVFQGYRGSARNVSAEIQARQEAARQSGHVRDLAHAIEQSDELFVLWGSNDELIICNARFREINQQLASTTLPGTKFETHVRAALAAGLYPDAVGREEQWFAQRYARHLNPHGLFEQRRQDGQYLLIHEQRLDSATVTNSINITQQKAAESQERQTQKLQAVGQLVGGIAHDFNNLLSTVLGNAQLGLHHLAKHPDDRLQRYFSEIGKAGERGSGRVRQLLTFSRGESGDVTAIDLAGVIAETA